MSDPDRRSGAASGEFAHHWRALAGCTLAAAVGTTGLSAYTGGAFMPALVAGAGYTREQLSLATLLLSAAIALTAPFVGQVIDRWGAVRVVGAAVVGEALGFALLGASPAHFGWFAAGMVVLAVLGVGTTPPSFSRIVAARFDRHRGLALGMMISGLGVVAIFAPILMTRVIAAAGWRGGYFTLALAVLVLGGGGFALIRHDPSSRTDSADARRARVGGQGGAQVGGGWGALRRPLFWYLLLCFAAPALFGGGYLLHLITILHQRGFTPVQAAQTQALVGVSIIAGRLCSGYAMDRAFAPYVAAVAFAVSAAGTALLLATSGPLLCLGALLVGLTIGAELDILAYVTSRYFGIASFGRLYSLAYSVMIFSGGASPLLIATLAHGGEYHTALIVSAMGTAAAAGLVAMLPRFAGSVAERLAPS